MHVLAGQELAKRAQGILHRVIPAFNEIVKLLQHPVQRDEAQEKRPFLRTDPREVPIFDQQSVSSRGPLLPGESVWDCSCEVASKKTLPAACVRQPPPGTP